MLPELLNVKEFVNADEIARGISPFQPEKVAIAAGRIMLQRLKHLLFLNEDFAFETTLSTKSFVGFIKQAKDQGYQVYLIYYWLDSVELAVERVKNRVVEGGHNIPTDTIKRRYYAGLNNFIHLYKQKVDYWMLIDNSQTSPILIAEGRSNEADQIKDLKKWALVQKYF